MNPSNDSMDGGSNREALGARLRRAREDRGMTVAMAATTLKVPATVVEALEREAFAEIGAPVFVRGHLRAYVRMLGMPDAVWEHAAQQWNGAEPVLRTSSHVSHARFLADRYAMRAVYMLLTLSIIVPALWVATQHAPVELRNAARSLDVPTPLSSLATAPAAPLSASDGRPVAAQPPAADPLPAVDSVPADGNDLAVMASLAPFYPAETAAKASPDATDELAAPDPANANELVFVFNADSWFEVNGRDGERLAYGLARAGETRRFAARSVARVAIGNVSAVSLSRGGEPVSLEAHRRANVARFAVSSDGEIQAAGG